MKEKTFALIKPDAVKAKNTGNIISIIEDKGFEIIAMEKIGLSREKAAKFYSAHKDRPFFQELIDFIISGPVVALVLEKEDAISQWRNLMGETDSKKAKSGTIRNLFGTDVGKNATHGSDSKESSEIEINLFFPNLS